MTELHRPIRKPHKEKRLLRAAKRAAQADDFELMYLLLDVYAAMKRCIYLHRPLSYGQRRKGHWREAIDAIHKTPPEDFRRNMRISYYEFHTLLNLIKDNPIFQFKAGRPQAEPIYQLTVALYRLGTNGNGANAFYMADKFEISEGTLVYWTERVILAILDLESDAISWPDPEERESLSDDFEDAGIPGGCVGIIDGMHTPLACKPHCEDGMDFYCYRGFYGFTSLVICDIHKRIRHFQVGFPSSAHDNRLWECSLPHQAPENYFSGAQYLLADSAFKIGPHIVPLFKQTPGHGELSRGEVSVAVCVHPETAADSIDII
ncbi:hypothetical protein I316_05589 [Kwoniella heveanensis BCC8398]|uniref:DDE Tnp4 domain-containing protein n=1 Tax=Kwoniella heveanensis BCC8398 TaxID=1296120 RepID=A0A1B9GNW0_9TREE|nr:hypothetical protein I316_05589 [Kwoniella heveanensis BCC8398]